MPPQYNVSIEFEPGNTMPWKWSVSYQREGTAHSINNGWTETRWGARRKAKRTIRQHKSGKMSESFKVRA